LEVDSKFEIDSNCHWLSKRSFKEFRSLEKIIGCMKLTCFCGIVEIISSRIVSASSRISSAPRRFPSASKHSRQDLSLSKTIPA
jgi:hypothetical protein